MSWLRNDCAKRAVTATIAMFVILLSPALASAQRTIVASASAAVTEHRVSIGDGAEQATGIVLGLMAETTVRPWLDVSLGASGGRLRADWPPSEDRTLGQLDITADASPLPWLGIVTTGTLRGYEGALGRQRWAMVSVGPEGRFTLYESMVQGSARVALVPLLSVSGTQAPERALHGSVALSYARKRLGVRLEYSIERYDFATSVTPRRLEQLSSLRLRAGWRWR